MTACPKEEPATLLHPTAGQALRECDASLKERSALLRLRASPLFFGCEDGRSTATLMGRRGLGQRAAQFMK